METIDNTQNEPQMPEHLPSVEQLRIEWTPPYEEAGKMHGRDGDLPSSRAEFQVLHLNGLTGAVQDLIDKSFHVNNVEVLTAQCRDKFRDIDQEVQYCTSERQEIEKKLRQKKKRLEELRPYAPNLYWIFLYVLFLGLSIIEYLLAYSSLRFLYSTYTAIGSALGLTAVLFVSAHFLPQLVAGTKGLRSKIALHALIMSGASGLFWMLGSVRKEALVRQASSIENFNYGVDGISAMLNSSSTFKYMLFGMGAYLTCYLLSHFFVKTKKEKLLTQEYEEVKAEILRLERLEDEKTRIIKSRDKRKSKIEGRLRQAFKSAQTYEQRLISLCHNINSAYINANMSWRSDKTVPDFFSDITLHLNLRLTGMNFSNPKSQSL